MHVLVIGAEDLFLEISEKFGSEFQMVHIENVFDHDSTEEYDFVFDFTSDESPDNVVELFDRVSAGIFFINTVKSSLAELFYLFGELPKNVLGFNGMKGFVNRDLWEVTTLQKDIPSDLENLPGDYLKVEDRVGMVSARVVCMIINEAYFTVQEGTASKADIDLGMKLGTSYPYGPFEWVNRIGIANIYELLEALYQDTGDERYKICPLLKKEYLLAE